MTMPTPPNDLPKVKFMISGPLSPDAIKNEPVGWTVGAPHPLLSSMSIVGIAVVPEGVEIYAASPDRKMVRSFIPMAWVRYVHETMPYEIFSEEYEASQLTIGAGWRAPEDDDDDDDFDDPETAPEPPAPTNGQPSP